VVDNSGTGLNDDGEGPFRSLLKIATFEGKSGDFKEGIDC